MRLLLLSIALGAALSVCAQSRSAQVDAPPAKLTEQTEPAPPAVQLPAGTKVPLTLINSISTKHSAVGDRVYLQTAFPIMSEGRLVIPPGSYVLGTVTELKRPGRVRGRGELFLRFDSITLPNGVVRDFRARVSNVDGRGNESLDRAEGKIKGDSNVGGDMKTIGETAAAGASIGSIAGAVSGTPLKGVGIGAAAGAAAGLMGVLLSRGPDAVLAQGSTIEMVLDRSVYFTPEELHFGELRSTHIQDDGPVLKKKDEHSRPLPF